MTNDNHFWVEVIDPETGRKLDVVIDWHADWASLEGPVAYEKLNRAGHAVIEKLVATRRFTGDYESFELSDYEPAKGVTD